MVIPEKYRRYINTRTVATAILVTLGFIHLFPMIYMFGLSIKGADEIFSYPPTVLPKSATLESYVAAFKAAPLYLFLLNSLVVATCITILQSLFAILAAFALARLNFKGKRPVFLVIIATMIVPVEITVVPNYLTIAKLGWMDSYFGLIAPFMASGFGIFMLYQFFRTIPQDLEDAAYIDGASSMRFLWQIVVPLSRPAIVGFAVYSFISAWNQFMWPLIVTQSARMQTVQIAISMFRSENEANSWAMLMAATVILILPSLVVFMVAQKQFVRGMTMSGIKQ